STKAWPGGWRAISQDEQAEQPQRWKEVRPVRARHERPERASRPSGTLIARAAEEYGLTASSDTRLAAEWSRRFDAGRSHTAPAIAASASTSSAKCRRSSA